MRSAVLVAVAVIALTSVAVAGAPPPRPDPQAVAAGGPRRVYYEVRMPARMPRGVVLALHPGGWCGVSAPGGRGCGAPEDRIRSDQADGGYSAAGEGRLFAEIARTAVRAGYVVVSPTYATDAPGLADVVAAYDQVHERWPKLAISAWGSSAGAHWALLLGVLRPLHAVIAEGAPADFTAWTGRRSSVRVFARHLLVQVFGKRAAAYDPARMYPDRRHTPVLLVGGRRVGGSETDVTVGQAPPVAFARADPDATLRLLGPGRAPWVHGRVDAGELRAARRAAVRALR